MQKSIEQQLLEQLRSGTLTPEEAMALNEELEQASDTVECLENSGLRKELLQGVRSLSLGVRDSLTHFERLCYRELDGDLSASEQAELTEILATYPTYARLYAEIRHTRLQPSPAEVYPHKERLKHEPVLVFSHTVWRVTAVAATLLLVITLGNSLLNLKLDLSVDRTSLLQIAEHTPAVLTEHREAEVLPTETSTATPVLLHKPKLKEGQTVTSEPNSSVAEPIGAPLLARVAVPEVCIPREMLLPPMIMRYRDPMPEAYHDWEEIMLAEEVENFENDVDELRENLRDERPFSVKFLDFVVTQLAARNN